MPKRNSASTNEDWPPPNKNTIYNDVQSDYNNANEGFDDDRKRKPPPETPTWYTNDDDDDLWGKQINSMPTPACYESPIFNNSLMDLSNQLSAMSLTPLEASSRNQKEHLSRAHLQHSFDAANDLQRKADEIEELNDKLQKHIDLLR
mmetsp:Transcript_15054/g.23364  ORF Transcript_15054/g.23364 Transcript_15054/m.23364 type:complete len:147 (+) Transcript_15054:346-786(+)|eukprot:CAMPEP_0196822988 /NCGR_PEP_ID=MMETSP1362-20130617/85612_1 /TAXON_ID=163516 /ORGANISM="Leptocylindrus danicus, Strain CCMP1856" /LENGTH=146 /DNA_ID=CAMNT_0042202699 /DNA_START=334 /DNA_END=774 /DNA_ORIENTATION=-